MVAKKAAATGRAYEDPQESGKAGKILAAAVFFGIALLLGYIVFAAPEPGTAMGSIQNVLRGLGGSLAIVIPLAFAWVGALLTMDAAGRKMPLYRSILYSSLFFLLLGGVQLFSAETIIQTRMAVLTYANFVNKSYTYGAGGGALGALIAWPLYSFLGKIGGFLAVLLLAALVLTVTGQTIRVIRRATHVADMAYHGTQEKLRERQNDRLFNVDEEKAPLPARHRAQRDAGVYLPTREPIRATEAVRPEPERRRKRRPAAASQADEAALRRARRERSEQSDIPSYLRTEPPEGTAPKRSRDKTAERADRIDRPSARPVSQSARGERSAAERAHQPKQPIYAVQTAASGKPAEAAVPVNPAETEEPAAVMETVPPKAAAARVHKARTKTVREDSVFDAETVRTQKAEEGQLPIVEDLTIEPEPCDVLVTDDGAQPRKPMGKLHRVAAELLDEDFYNYPPIDLLPQGETVRENFRDADMKKAELLAMTLEEFGIHTTLTGIAHGPAVTRFELQPAPGVKVSKITNLTDDIAMHLAATSVRIEAPIPGKNAVGVEIPNDKIETVRLRDVLESEDATKSRSKIAVGLGKDNSGRYIVPDIAKMPHVLIAGQTGSGKSVCINSIIVSILYRATPDEVRLMMIDPKVVELSVYNGIPHLVCPVVTDPKKAASALDWAVVEMEKRYRQFAERQVRNIHGYNEALKPGEKKMPQMVIIIDELADLMQVVSGEVEESIQRLAQKARAAGMHLIIATQRPSVNVVTGVIKANIPSRIAFSVSSQIDSRTIIDHAGAERLLGHGDMLFVPTGINKPMRVQGAWVSDEEVNAIVSYIKERSETTYDEDMMEQINNAVRSDAEKEEVASEYDPRLPEAVEIVVMAGQASVSMLQRKMRLGYSRAGRLIDEMEKRGIVSTADGAKPRTVLITREEMQSMFEDEPAE